MPEKSLTLKIFTDQKKFTGGAHFNSCHTFIMKTFLLRAAMYTRTKLNHFYRILYHIMYFKFQNMK
jgi:hypothetical protein